MVTQERLVYREEVEESKQQIMSHLVDGGVFVPPPPHAMIVSASNSIMAHSFYLSSRDHATHCSLTQSIFYHLGRPPSLVCAAKPSPDW